MARPLFVTRKYQALPEVPSTAKKVNRAHYLNRVIMDLLSIAILYLHPLNRNRIIFVFMLNFITHHSISKPGIEKMQDLKFTVNEFIKLVQQLKFYEAHQYYSEDI